MNKKELRETYYKKLVPRIGYRYQFKGEINYIVVNLIL